MQDFYVCHNGVFSHCILLFKDVNKSSTSEVIALDIFMVIQRI